MKYILDFVTNSSSGTMLASFSVMLTAIDADLARQAFAHAYVYQLTTSEYDAEAEDAETGEPRPQSAEWLAAAEAASSEARAQGSAIDLSYDAASPASVTLYKCEQHSRDGEMEATFTLAASLVTYLDESRPGWRLDELDQLQLQDKTWQDDLDWRGYLDWLDRRFGCQLPAQAVHLAGEQEFLAYGESESDVVDVTEAFCQAGLVADLREALGDRLPGIIYQYDDVTDGYVRQISRQGLTAPQAVFFSLNNSINLASGPSKLGGLIKQMLNEAALDPASIGLHPVLLTVLRRQGLSQTAENLLRDRQASLLFASDAYANIVIWFGDQDKIKVFQNVGHLLRDLGLGQTSRPSAAAGRPLQDCRFVIVGELASMTLAEAGRIIERLGGQVLPDLTADTDYLVIGDRISGLMAETRAAIRIDRAKELAREGQAIRILRENEFLRRISKPD